MRSRTLTVALLLFLGLAVPVAASAGECSSIVVAFEIGKDAVEFISLSDAAHAIQVLFYANDGTFLRDTVFLPAVGARARVRVTAKELYNTWGANPPSINDTYLRLSLPGAPFAATLTSAGATREVGCVSS